MSAEPVDAFADPIWEASAPPFPEQHERLSRFLAAPERPPGTMSFHQLAGFLFAVASSPELILIAEWMPLVFNDGNPGFESVEEGEQITRTIMQLHDWIDYGVVEGTPQLPPTCELRAEAIDNLQAEAPLSQWSLGFISGHIWLEDAWPGNMPDHLAEDFAASLMILSFFSSRESAEQILKESNLSDAKLGELSQKMAESIPLAMENYAALGHAISVVLEESMEEDESVHHPAVSTKIGRNEPCPCGSGKKYKKCCGAASS